MIDAIALVAHLSDAGLVPPGTTARITPLFGGAVRRNWRIEAADGATFAMRAPSLVGLRDSHPLRHEFDIQMAAHTAGVTTPRPLWFCADTDLVGTPFYVSEFVPGTAEPAVINGLGESPRHEIANRVGQELAKVHEKMFHMKQSPQVPVDKRWTHSEQLRADASAGLNEHGTDPLLRNAVDWLAANEPDTETTVFAHRDFRLGNILIDGTAFTAILDWEFARPSDPHEDLGWFTARCWRRLAPDTPAYTAAGLAPLDTFLTAYGRPVDEEKLTYWQIAAHVRWAVIAGQQIARARSIADPQLTALRDYLPGLRNTIAAMIGLDRRVSRNV